jgi:two-component system, response regulator
MAKAKILVIEDNESEIFLLRRALKNQEGEGFELVTLGDGEDALQFIHTHCKTDPDFDPCVILLDLHLPKHDGLEILRAIRRDAGLKDVPVLVTTNSASPREAEELRRMNTEYRLKPHDLAGFAKLALDLVAICNGSEVIA